MHMQINLRSKHCFESPRVCLREVVHGVRSRKQTTTLRPTQTPCMLLDPAYNHSHDANALKKPLNTCRVCMCASKCSCSTVEAQQKQQTALQREVYSPWWMTCPVHCHNS